MDKAGHVVYGFGLCSGPVWDGHSWMVNCILVAGMWQQTLRQRVVRCCGGTVYYEFTILLYQHCLLNIAKSGKSNNFKNIR